MQDLTRLRAALTTASVDGFLLATGDEHLSEYPAAYAARLRWLTGFRGSSGTAIVLHDRAAMFVDSRYIVSVRALLAGTEWTCEQVPMTVVGEWMGANAAAGTRIGFDPWVHSVNEIRTHDKALAGRPVRLVPLDDNPIDALWRDQPARPASPLFVQPETLTGRSSADKRRALAEWLASIGGDACVLVALDSIAWLLNIRGSDVDIVPCVYGYAVARRDGTLDLFVDPDRVDAEVRQHLGDGVRLHAYASFGDWLATLRGQCVSLDPDRTPVAIASALVAAKATIREDPDPTLLPKSIKTEAERNGIRAAHIRDGAALTRYLHWVSLEAPKGQLTELSAARVLNGLRAEVEGFHSLSFPPISAAGAHAALPHYMPTPESDTPIRNDAIYLIDSGGQYPEATTDITRTVIVGQPTPEMKDRFTRVLKGHIALARCVFPDGTRGTQLDTLARQYLWEAGIDYGHGTGHGVGAFLSVHEFPPSIGVTARSNEPLRAGMLLSNEPGYYKPGAFGIRVENLMLVVERTVPGAEIPVLGFETVSFAPIDRNLIEPGMLTESELDWLNDYHVAVMTAIGPRVPAATRAWLEKATARIHGSAA
jgi:Xaa-Pro aminopeptidase